MTPIFVIGSSGTDMIVKSKKIPAPGETVLGGEFLMTPGGKGANQAVAAARLGGKVTFVANLGNDVFGKQALDRFQKESINTAFMTIDNAQPSQVALIMVDSHGQNSIAVAPGSNGNLRYESVEKALAEAVAPAIVLVQLEIPLPTVEFAIAYGGTKGLRVILNPAPAQKIRKEVLQNLFLITPNESEAKVLTGVTVTNPRTAKQAAEKLHRLGVINVIITMGAKGAYIHNKNLSMLVPAPKVKAVDTTGAGDSFNGALAFALSQNLPLEKAVSFAVKAASISVTRMGAQASMPYGSELKK